MARPRVFISSTFYDLKQYRYDIEQFIKQLGYEPIMNDRGHIPFDKNIPLEDNCYDEVSRSDILIGIIGNSFGTTSEGDGEYSISMREINTAIRNNKQLFMFVEKTVLNENKLFKNNKSKDVSYVAVDNIKIHKFIEEIEDLRMNNAIIPFESVNDIENYLREQFAGLFQKLLQDKAVVTEQTTYYDLKASITEFKSLVEQQKNSNEEMGYKLNGSIFNTNLLLTVLREKLGMEKAIFFAKDRDALNEIMKFFGYEEEIFEFGGQSYINKQEGKEITIMPDAFINDELKIFRHRKAVSYTHLTLPTNREV